MRSRAIPPVLVVAALLASSGAGQTPPSADAGLRGRVTTPTLGAKSADAASPLGRVTVYAYELAQLAMHKVVTGPEGEFRFEALPAGVYKLIAFKPGYDPAVVMLSRAAAEALQFVELHLSPERPREPRAAEGFWAVRDQIPPDVLRDLEAIRLAELSAPSGGPTRAFHTAVRAITGVEELGGAAAQLAAGGIGMEGRIGSVELGVSGEFWRLASGLERGAMAGPDGRGAALAVRMAGTGEGLLDVTTVSQTLPPAGTTGEGDADFERYRVSWSQPLGERSRSRFEAQYTAQSNFFRPPVPAQAASELRALNLEGAYQLELSERALVEAGLRYRERDGWDAALEGLPQPQRALEIFGKGGWRLQPSVLVEYGLFTQLRDGSLALAPHGGVVVQLGPRWQATASGSHRVDRGEAQPLDGFSPVRFAGAGQSDAGRCQDLEAHCYRVVLAREGEDEQLLAVGFLHRELAETLHLYFDDDFVSRLESLYLVRGDELPEVQLVAERRVAPRVLARLESTYAEGGGGILYAVDGEPHRNRVRYLVTSLDTRFQRSSTGVFVAFHQLEQSMESLEDRAETGPMELERLQLMLSQDLDVLARLAADWSVHLNLEVSRGALPFTLQDPAADELRRRVTGGLSVKF